MLTSIEWIGIQNPFPVAQVEMSNIVILTPIYFDHLCSPEKKKKEAGKSENSQRKWNRDKECLSLQII